MKINPVATQFLNQNARVFYNNQLANNYHILCGIVWSIWLHKLKFLVKWIFSCLNSYNCSQSNDRNINPVVTRLLIHNAPNSNRLLESVIYPIYTTFLQNIHISLKFFGRLQLNVVVNKLFIPHVLNITSIFMKKYHQR